MRFPKIAANALFIIYCSCTFELAVAQTVPDAVIRRAERIQSCSRKSPLLECLRTTRPEASITRNQSIRSLVAVETVETETHPSWSPAERNAVIRKALEAFTGEIQHAEHLAVAAQNAEARFRVKLGFNFRSAAFSNRTLDQWVNLPRTMTISVDILDALQPSSSAAKSTISLSTGISTRPRLGFDNNARWYKKYSAAITQEARSILLDIDEPADLLSVQTDASGKSFIDGSGLVFPGNTLNVLLVPQDAKTSMSDWSIATVAPTSLTKTLRLDLLRGNRDTCRNGCVAAIL